MSAPSGFGSARILEGSSHVQIVNSQFHTNIHGSPFEYLRILDAEVATNAILNAGGRVDIPKCHPGTREEVISKSERWMTVGYREDRRIFWLSGPAGAGKSAIVQTLAERCIDRGAVMANYFFFRADGSRNHSRPVVATLLHQLLEVLPGLTPTINDIISRNRLVFRKALSEQFKLLIDGPVRALRPATPDARPIILLIDGLDECDSRADLDNATLSEQRTLLQALHGLVTSVDSQFIVLVASRVESHIQMEFDHIGHSKLSIYVSQDSRADKDIHLYISAELSRIKNTHPLRCYLPENWPFASAVDSIVEKSSGQFIYASTVLRFMENSTQSPAISLDMLLSLRATAGYSPFAELDALYIFILSRCRAWVPASEIIAVFVISGAGVPPSLLGYTEDEAASFLSDLTSIIEADISRGTIKLTFYHASFNDFIYTPKRAGRYHINLTSYTNSLAPRLILAISDYSTFWVAVAVLREVNQRSKALTDALMQLPCKPEGVDWEGSGRDVKNFLLAPVELYAKHDTDLYRRIFNHMKQKNWIPAYVYLSPKLSICNMDLQNICK